jgi:serine/threonine protein kinase
MEFGSLFDFEKKINFTLLKEHKIKILYEICEGIKFMHDNNIVHLDLKPLNILMNNRT